MEASNVTVAQVLLTLEDSERRRRYLNARATLESLLALGALPSSTRTIPLQRPKSATATTIASLPGFAQMAGADCLVLLSDVEGLFTSDPNKDPKAQFVQQVRQITPQIEAMAGASASAVGSGGMTTKIMAAKIAVAAGCHMCIASGHTKHPVSRLEEGARCTWFVPHATPATARKQWIAGTLQPAGSISIDPGALKALHEGKSLLPAGVVAVRGRLSVAIRSVWSVRRVPRLHAASSRIRMLIRPVSWGANLRDRGNPRLSGTRRDHPSR